MENLIKGGYKEMSEYLKRLYLNPEITEKIGRQMAEKTRISSKEESVKNILRIGDDLYRTMIEE